jgi:hypothetical protein
LSPCAVLSHNNDGFPIKPLTTIPGDSKLAHIQRATE